MHVLVTGAAGFLGSHMVDALLGEGHSVAGVDNFITGSPRNIAHLDREKRFDFMQQDITEPFDPGPMDWIINMASPASPVDYGAYGIETLMAGAVGVRTVLELAKRYQAHFLQASSSDCYGDPVVHPQPESYWGHVNAIGPRSVYSESKRFAEALVMAYRRYEKIDTHIVRIFNTYGPRLQVTDGRVISTFLRQALRGEDLTVYGDGSQTRSFCYVSDQIEGQLRLMHSSENLPVNMGNPDEFTILECAQAVLAITGSQSRLAFEPLPQDDPRQRRPDITRARELLDWEPKIGLPEGLRRTLPWFRPELERLAALAGPVEENPELAA
jgi:dTDP-glucose 4,6-dehydratase